MAMGLVVVADDVVERMVHVWTCGRTDRHSYSDPQTGLYYVYGEADGVEGWLYAGEESDELYAILGED